MARLWPRLRSDTNGEAEALRQQTASLEQRVSTLQAALKQSEEASGRWVEAGRKRVAGVAALTLILGFVLGVIGSEMAKQTVGGLAQVVGFGNTDPYTAFQNHKYRAALRLARPLAAEGNARAQSVLGLVYYQGHSVRQDDSEAVKWFRLAANQGDAVAQFHLGVMFSEGQGVPRDDAEAVKWFSLAANQGDPQAQYILGMAYASGEVGKKDDVSAYMWLDLAAARLPASDLRRRNAVLTREQLTNRMAQDQIAAAQERAREWTPK